MNERFNKVIRIVKEVEGGYVNNPKDKGGATKYGIAFNYNQGILKNYGIAEPYQMRELTHSQALEIYYRKYWLPSQADEIPDIRLATVYFDHVVNAGQSVADALLAKLDKNFWHFEGDGKNTHYFWALTSEYLLHRIWWYAHIKQWLTFGLGWFNRLIKVNRSLPKL